MKQVQFKNVEIGSGFCFYDDRDSARFVKIEPVQRRLVTPCRRCGEPAVTRINATSGGVGLHVCPTEMVFVNDSSSVRKVEQPTLPLDDKPEVKSWDWSDFPGFAKNRNKKRR